jgi:lipopolysaccharide/colanic/teichoic acid biosynthesis glycosyltransferase
VADGWPVLFRQTRVGRDGRPFTMLKFRTMVPDAEARLDDVAHRNERRGPLFKAGDDPRVTRVGRILRHTSLDELPQLWNVLVGTMSLVGPRPALYPEREQFPPQLLARESMPPGMTGLWQLDGRTDPDFGKYTELDLRYVADWSLWLDLRILARTPFVVVRHGWAELRRVSTRVVHHGAARHPAAPATGSVVALPVEPRVDGAEATGAA